MSGIAGIAPWRKALQDIKAGAKNNNQGFSGLFNELSAGTSEMKGVFELAYYYIASIASGSPMQEAIDQRLMQIPTSKVQDNIDRGMMMQAITLCAIMVMHEMMMQENMREQNTNKISSLFNKLLSMARQRKYSKDVEEDYWEDYKQDMAKFIKDEPEEFKHKCLLVESKVDKAVNYLVSKLPKEANLTQDAIGMFKESMLNELKSGISPAHKMKKQ